jgi:hypothetical protein
MHQSKKQIIISGLLSVFLVTTLAITSSLINNPNFSLDIRNYAASLEKEELAYLKNVYKPPATTQTQQPAKAVVTKAVVNKTDEGDSEAALRANLAATATQAQAVAAEQAQVAAAKLAAQKAADAKALQEEEATLRANLSTPVPSPTTTTTTVTSKDEDINGNSLNSTTTYTNTTSTNPTTGQTVQTTTISDVSANNPTVSQNATLVKTTNSDKTTNTAITSSTTNNSTISQIEKTDEGFIKTDTTIKRDVTTGNIVAANSTSKLLESDKDRLTKLYQDKTCGGLKTGESCVPIQGTAQYGITQNSGATAISYNSGVTAGQPTSVPVVTNAQESQSFWQQLGSKFNDASNDTGLVGMGTGGLGMDGNTTAIPQSVITSNDPEAVNNYLLGSTLAVAAGAGAAAATVAAPVVYSAGPAIAAYSSATISTTVAALPAAVQTGLAVAGTTAAIAAPYLGMNQCIQSGDPGSPACVGMVTGYMSNPLEAEYALSDSYNALKNILPSVEADNVFSSPALDPIMAEIQTDGGQKMLDHYIKNNKGPIPKQIFVHKTDNDFYSFQTKLIEAAKDKTVDSKLLAETMRELEATGNVRFVIESADEIKALCGGNAYCRNKYYPEVGRKLPTVHIPSPSDFAATNGKSLAQAETELGGILGHEVGHAWDDAILPIYGIDPNSNEGLWATELMQYEFSRQYKAAQGLTNKVLEDFVGHIYSSAEIIKAQVK